MMPGVVAGFPQKAGIVMHSAQSAGGSSYGFYSYGFMNNPYGSLTPVGATVVPGGNPSPGGVGEIRNLYWWPEYAGEILLDIRGPYANAAAIPFTSMLVGGADV